MKWKAVDGVSKQAVHCLTITSEAMQTQGTG